MDYTFYITVGLMLFSGILGYTVGVQGLSGIEADISAAKLDIANIKGKLSGPQIVTPVANSEPTTTSATIVTPSI